MTSNVSINQIVRRHFRAWYVINIQFFFGKSFIAFKFLSPHLSELDSVHSNQSYVDFQPVALSAIFYKLVVSWHGQQFCVLTNISRLLKNDACESSWIFMNLWQQMHRFQYSNKLKDLRINTFITGSEHGRIFWAP